MPVWIRYLGNVLGCLSFWTPNWARKAFGRCIAFLWFDVFRFRRLTLLRNVTIAFPEVDKQRRREIAKASLAQMGLYLIEFLSLPAIRSSWMDKNVTFHGLDIFERASKQGSGVLLLSLHLGNGDFACSMLALKGLQLNLISKKFKNKSLNNFWFGLRELMGIRFIEAHGSKTAFEILSACRRKEAVVFVLDQFMGKPFGIKSTFFGRRTGTAYGLALFAIKTKAPVVPVYTYRDPDLRTHIVFEEPLTLAEEKDDRDLQIAQTTQKYNDWIESVVRRYPEQWMWIHRRWKKWE